MEFRTKGAPTFAFHVNFRAGTTNNFTWWTFRPRKKYLGPPPEFPNSPQTPSRPLGPSWPPPPLLGFSIKNRSLPPQRLRLPPFPLPEQKKEKISETSNHFRAGTTNKQESTKTKLSRGIGPGVRTVLDLSRPSPEIS